MQIRPGSESALAAGIARVLLEEKLVAARAPMPEMTLSEASAQTGLDANVIRELARTIVDQSPAVAIVGDSHPAIAVLNVVLGAVGHPGGIVRRSKAGKPYASADAAIVAARAVLLDSSVPWSFVPRTDAEVFRFAAWNGGASHADWLLPAPGFLEELTDVPSAPTAGIETYAVAPSLAKAGHKTMSCAEFLASFDPTLNSAEKIIHARCADLFRRRAGVLHARERNSVAGLSSLSKLEDELWSGAVWVGEPVSGESIRCELKQWPVADAGSSLDWKTDDGRTDWPGPVMPSLATKLYQESGLRDAQGRKA
jgi:hypothetical protein